MFRLIALFFLCTSTAWAKVAVAVLDLQTSSLQPKLLGQLADDVRAGVFDAIRHRKVKGDPLLLMTRENMISVLESMGKSQQCLKGDCEVELGRNMGADYIFSGQVNDFDSTYVLNLRVHETKKGTVRATGKVASKDPIDLMNRANRLALRLTHEGVLAQQLQAEGYVNQDAPEWAPKASDRRISLSSAPSGATVLLNGNLLCSQTPCTRNIPHGEHTLRFQKQRYFDANYTPSLNGSDAVFMQLSPRFGWFSAKMAVDGGMLGLNGQSLNANQVHRLEIVPGSHLLEANSPCHRPLSYRFKVLAGEHNTDIPILRPTIRESAIKVYAFRDQNALDGTVYVDGQKVGEVGEVVKVPLCSKQLFVKTDKGEWSKVLALRENQVQTIHADIVSSRFGQTRFADETIRIPAGRLRVGDEVQTESSETNAFLSLSQGFLMMRSEVTQKAYRRVMGKNPSFNSECGNLCPVDSVSWVDAVVFANRLSRLDGLETCYRIEGDRIEWPSGIQCHGWRLPTEAEWVFAAFGVQSFNGSEMKAVDAVAWHRDNSEGRSHRVCQKEPNSFGLCDMSGNVNEWIWDGYNDKLSVGITVPKGPGLSVKVLRGTSWADSPDVALFEKRHGANATDKKKWVGFRLVRRVD